MNVYVRELVSALAQAGVDCTVYVRTWREGLAPEVAVEPGFRVRHIDAGPPDLPKEALPETVDEFADKVRVDLEAGMGADVIHANYWLSGLAGHRLKHELDLPLVSTFHTLARVKAETGDDEPERRVRSEAEIIGCSDAILASCTEEARSSSASTARRRADRDRAARRRPRVLLARRSPGARTALDLGDQPVLLFVGRIQPLKGLDVAVRTLAELDHPDAVLVVVGGPSGKEGDTYLAEVESMAAALGVAERVRFVPPQPHHLLSSYYRAADVCLVPSRSESFGLVALEAAACGTPVVAAAVGGLRTLVDHGHTGFLVEGRDPEVFAAYAEELLDERRARRRDGRRGGGPRRRVHVVDAAARLRRLYADLTVGALVECS